MSHPKLFISYSWSSAPHEKRVLDFATSLCGKGIDVILDKWDLEAGHDAIAFMEKMVSDPSVTKVAMICDAEYAKKADNRDGGVGTETQIISQEVYNKQKQDKFVAVVFEKNEDGSPCLPTYYQSRIYIDFSEPEHHTEELEKIVRWVFDKPVHQKPGVGPAPSYLDNPSSTQLETSTQYRRAIDCIKNEKTIAAAALEDYLSRLIDSLNRLEIKYKNANEFDELVIESIDAFLPYRNEFISMLTIIARYSRDKDLIEKLHRFFESSIPFMYARENAGSYRDWDFDNYKFIIHELFLYSVAIFMKHERFEYAEHLMAQQYYLTKHGAASMADCSEFHQYLASFKTRNSRLGLNRTSLRADLLKKRSSDTGLEFRYLMQADFILYLRKEILSDQERWWPETLLYSERYNNRFEIFVRASSKKYFDKMKCLLGIDKPDDLKILLDKIRAGKVTPPQMEL